MRSWHPRQHGSPVARPGGALAAAGVESERVCTDKLSVNSTREQRPGMVALLDFARPGGAVVVVGIHRMGRNAAEVIQTIGDRGERNIVLRSLRQGIDTSNVTGRMVAGILASLAELEWSGARNAVLLRGRPAALEGRRLAGLR